jgi:uncharacterized protein YhaN
VRITDLKVDGFGVWSGLELPEFSDQLNVFYGANEAGKTTLMQFVRSILYGFSPERRARYLPPVRAGRPGGTLGAVAAEQAYTISRYADEPGEVGEAALVSDGREAVHDPHALATLLGEVDEPTFNNVFAIGLREIQELSTLGDTQAADELYKMTLGLDRVSLVDVLAELDASRNRLLASDDRPSLVMQLLGQRQRLQSEIEDLSQSTVRYLSLMADREKLQTGVSRLEAENVRLEQEGRELGLARALGERWQRRVSIERQLAGLGSFEALPPNALARFDRVETRLAARRRRLARLKSERRELATSVEQLNINEALCRQALRLEALGEQQQWIGALQGQVESLESEVLELESEREDGNRKLGLKPDADGGAAEPLSKRDLAELRAAAKALRRARVQARECHQQIAATAEKVADRGRQIETALGAAKERGLTKALAEAGELVSQLRKRIQLDERLDQMSRRETELEEQGHEHLQRQMLPTWVLGGLGALFAAGCALVLLFVAGLVLPASMSGSLGWPLGFVGVLAAAAAGLTKFGLERSAAKRLDACHQQIHLLGQQMKQAKQDRDELDEQLPKGGGPLVARLQTAEKELARLEELLPLESQRDTAERDAAGVRQQRQSLGEECRRLRKNWRQLLSVAGLPVDLAPRQLHEYCRRREQMRGLKKAIDEKHAELTRRRGEYDTLTGRITQLIAEVGVTPTGRQPLEQLQQCLAELKVQQSRLHRRDELARQIARLRRRKIKFSRLIDQLRQRRKSLLHAAGTDDEQEFRRRAQAQVDSQRLQAERVQIAHEISSALGGQCSEEKLAHWLADPAGLDRHEAQAADARRTLAAQLAELLEKRGEMNEQLKRLVESRQLSHLRIELGIVEKRLADALDRWRVLTVCGMMLGSVRDYYEREHQPQALREASLFLQRLTSGRYTRVWTPLGEPALRVDDSAGTSLRVEVLSRGTREQLFLALRLALVNAYARRGVQLPLVLDDVLVNFDVVRAKAAALVLRDFAKQGHQILIFTCHEHIAKIFKNLKAEVRQLPDNAVPHASALAEQAVRRARRTRPETPFEPEPEPEEELEPDADEVETEPCDPPAAVAEISAPFVPAPEPSPPARTVRADPPEPPPRPSRPMSRAKERHIERSSWSAEEFDGELADRVRQPGSSADGDAVPGDDADAA